MILATAGLLSTAACLNPSWGYEPQAPVDEAPPDESIEPDTTEPAQCPAVGGIPYQRPRPNVMFLVDRSGSMSEPGACADATCPSKWQPLLALGSYLEDINGSANLGASVFPAVGGGGPARRPRV